MLKRYTAHSVLIQVAVLLAACLPYLINLGASSIWDANEAFYAETPREMLVSGDYMAPRFNFEPRAQKPPLTYWIILVSYKLFGVSEFSVRLPSALAAIGTVLFSFGLARLLFNPGAALFAALITATTARVFILARRLPIDILLLFLLTGTLFFLVRAIQRSGRYRWAWVYVFAGLGFLAKGPVAIAIPAGTYIFWSLWRRRLRLREIHPLMGAGLLAGITLPWYLYSYAAYGWTYISPFFLRDNLGRFATQTLGPSRSILYYFPVYATDFFPWSILALLSFVILWKQRGEQPLRNLSFGLPVIWCALIFVLFSLSKNKQEYYIAPMYPAAAVILAGVFDRTIGKRKRDQSGNTAIESETGSFQIAWFWVCGALAGLFLCLALALPYVLRAFMPNLSAVSHYGPSAFFIGGVLWLLYGVWRKQLVQCFSGILIPIWTIFLVCALLYLPALEPFRPVKSFCRVIEAQADGTHEAGAFGTALPSMVYYLRRPVFEEHSRAEMLRKFRSEKQVFCILYRKDFGYFTNQKDLTLHILDRRSHFALRFKALMKAGYQPEEELLLVSNRPYSRIKFGGSGPTS